MAPPFFFFFFFLLPHLKQPSAHGNSRSATGTDVLVVTWTVDEGHALSRVLTPGKDSRNDYVPYKRNFAAISKEDAQWLTRQERGTIGCLLDHEVGSKRVVVFKSESHMSQDTAKKQPPAGATLPNEDLWKQIIEEVNPKLVITTGTLGASAPSVRWAMWW